MIAKAKGRLRLLRLSQVVSWVAVVTAQPATVFNLELSAPVNSSITAA